MGAGLGVGCTHTALASAYYAADILKAKTALVEIGKNRALRALKENAEDSYDNLKAFIREGIHVFYDASPERLTGILNGDFEYVILDITDNEKDSVEEFMRADLQFLVCSLSEWRMSELENCLDIIVPLFGKKMIKTVTSIMDNKWKKTTLKGNVSSDYRIKTYTMPFVADPFNPEKTHMGFFRDLFNYT
ncbi:MAG: hypothetical protein K6E56_06250 [Lachnospiraceae bacterium]|nr:hypothetical protein [Lachnospiraceae bacterium]